MPESNLAQNVITPWAYNLYGMMNPYAYSVPNPFNPMNDYGRTPPPVGGVNIPDWILNGTAPGNPMGGGVTPTPGGITPTPGGPGAPTGGPTGAPMRADPSNYLTNQYYNMYQNLGFNRGFQAAQSPEEIFARSALANRFAMGNADFNAFFGTGALGNNATATRWMNRGMGGFDQNGNYIGGQNGPLYNAALGNLGIIKDGGAFGKYNTPDGWSNLFDQYGDAAKDYMGSENPLGDYNAWDDSLIPINAQLQGDFNALAYYAPGEAENAMKGITQDRRGQFVDPATAAANGMSQVNPFLDRRLDQATGAWQKGNDAGFRIAEQRDRMGYDPNALAQRGVSDVVGQNNQYADALMRNIDAESRRSLATQTPEVAAAMAAAGYGESGAGQAAMGSLVSSILEKANQDKQSTLANLTESNLARQAQAIGQRTSVGAQNAADVLNTQASMYQNAYNQREQARNLTAQLGAGAAGDIYRQQLGAQNSMNDAIFGATAQNIAGMQQDANRARANYMQSMYGTTADMLKTGMVTTQQNRGNLANQILGTKGTLLSQGLQANTDRGNLLAQLQNNALFQSEDAQRQRAMSQLQANATGQDMQMKMWQANQANYTDRLNQALSMGRSYQDYEQQYRNQIAEQLLMPFKTGLQVTTGINTSPVPSNYRVNPLANAGINLGANVLGGMFGGGGGGRDAVDPYSFG